MIILSSIRLDGATESLISQWDVDRKMFDDYIEYTLSPNLRPGNIVMMGTLGSYKSKIAQEILINKCADIF